MYFSFFQGHLSFPSVLDLSPFINFEVRNEKREIISPCGSSNEKFKHSFPLSKYQNLQHDLGMPLLAAKSLSSETEVSGEHGRNAIIYQDGHCPYASEEGSSSNNSRRYSDGNVSFSLKASEAGQSSFRSRKFGEGNVSFLFLFWITVIFI